jgi:hypothetical protein
MEWIPPQATFLSQWTELVEFCDWDEEAASLLIAQVCADLPPHPPEHIKQIARNVADALGRQEKQAKSGEA